MSDKVDDLILQMQHLEAGAKAAQQARAQGASADKLKSKAAKLAVQLQAELEAAQQKLAQGEELMQRARAPGVDPREAGEFHLSGRLLVEENKPAVVKLRAKLGFALDALDEADRRAWEAMQADARADAHNQLAGQGTAAAAPQSTLPDPTKGA